MPLELTSAGRPVQLSPGTGVQLEWNSPLFDEDTMKGTFSYSLAVPAGPNGPLYGFPERPDGATAPGALLPAELSLAGLPLLSGRQRIKAASPSKYTVNLQDGLSGAGLSERQLSSFAYGGLREVPRYVPLAGVPGTSAPGLTLHANAVVASPADYDYVFAPLRNEYQATNSALPLVYPVPNTVNPWTVRPVPVLGMPAGGSFTYYIQLSTGAPGSPVTDPWPPYCPFPKLRYVLQAICEESGLAVDVAQLLPGELGELVIAGNAQLVDRGDAQTLRFSLADVLPALTVAQLLAALRQDLGVVVYVDPLSRRVRSARLSEQVAPGAPYVDLSARLAGDPEVSIDDTPAGVTLTYQVDGDDALTKDLLSQQPASVGEPVATVADLPATGPLLPSPPLPRLVLAEQVYYQAVASYRDLTSVSLSWSRLVEALPPVLVAGGGEAQAMASCYTRELATELQDASGVTLALPAISQPPYRADQTAVERSAVLRLLFYRGLQLASDGVMRCPQLSHQSASGALSVRLGGAQGTYAQLLEAWLPFKRSAVSYQVPLLLTPLDLARLDLAQPLRLDGVAYLVRKLSATVPLQKPATAELVRL